jgi:hypothetical protein
VVIQRQKIALVAGLDEPIPDSFRYTNLLLSPSSIINKRKLEGSASTDSYANPIYTTAGLVCSFSSLYGRWKKWSGGETHDLNSRLVGIIATFHVSKYPKSR